MVKEQDMGRGPACQALWGAASGEELAEDASRLSSPSSPSTSLQCLPARIWAYFAIWGGTIALRRASTWRMMSGRCQEGPPYNGGTDWERLHR